MSFSIDEMSVGCHYLAMASSHSLKKIGYLVRFYRRKMDLSQMQFADELGISFRNLQRLEMGEVEPKLATLDLIASYLKIPISSLIRPTDETNLFIKNVSTQQESHYFIDLNQKSNVLYDDLKLTHRMIQKDRQFLNYDITNYASLDGTKVRLSDCLGELTGINEQNQEIDQYIAFGTSLERWEYVFRAQMKEAIIQNFYFFPKGFKVFEEFHFNLNPNPDSPTSECYIRDITSRYELETWLRLVHANRLSY